ncbi:MAG TPA: hypothetical protein VMR65_00295 [Candidatus Sulfotelmatobacter sp.]|jgi:hypothetical protein|nr:hypothetical protein [Candidatus Sulfotelmatobacter sp.]
MSAISPDRRPAAVDGCLQACRRCVLVVEAALAHDGPRSVRAWSAVAPHLRHCVEHFQLLLEGWSDGRVDYDARARNARLERDPAAMRAALEAIVTTLERIEERDLDRALAVTQSVASGRAPRSSPSCLDRELAFLSGHTIHHIAIMVLAAESAGAVIPEHLAVAFSTEAHREPTLAPS